MRGLVIRNRDQVSCTGVVFDQARSTRLMINTWHKVLPFGTKECVTLGCFRLGRKVHEGWGGSRGVVAVEEIYRDIHALVIEPLISPRDLGQPGGVLARRSANSRGF